MPYRILVSEGVAAPNEWSWVRYPAVVAIAGGLAILLRCVWEFAHHGRGTLAPFDEPRHLVVQGLYRYVRNPMYVGVVLMLVGQSWLFWSRPLLLYALGVFVAFNVFIMGYEELRLRAKFGPEYEDYCRHVGRWIPARPYRGAD